MGRKICSHPGCTLPAAGFVPLDKEEYSCAEHLDDKAQSGYFTVLLSEKVCPACDGRSWKSRELKCVRCDNTGVVKAAKNAGTQFCKSCGGSGVTRRRGRPQGSEKIAA